jgi:hypothetical protein
MGTSTIDHGIRDDKTCSQTNSKTCASSVWQNHNVGMRL